MLCRKAERFPVSKLTCSGRTCQILLSGTLAQPDRPCLLNPTTSIQGIGDLQCGLVQILNPVSAGCARFAVVHSAVLSFHFIAEKQILQELEMLM